MKNEEKFVHDEYMRRKKVHADKVQRKILFAVKIHVEEDVYQNIYAVELKQVRGDNKCRESTKEGSEGVWAEGHKFG